MKTLDKYHVCNHCVIGEKETFKNIVIGPGTLPGLSFPSALSLFGSSRNAYPRPLTEEVLSKDPVVGNKPCVTTQYPGEKGRSLDSFSLNCDSPGLLPRTQKFEPSSLAKNSQ